VACQSDMPLNCGVSIRHVTNLVACQIPHATNYFSEVLLFNTSLISDMSKYIIVDTSLIAYFFFFW